MFVSENILKIFKKIVYKLLKILYSKFIEQQFNPGEFIMATAATTQNPFFNVERVPVFTKFEGREIELSKDVLINTETSLPVGIVGKDYKVVTNQEVNNIFGEALSSYKIKKTMDFMKKGGETWVRRIVFEDDELTFDVGNGDVSHVMLEIFNGFNTTVRVGYNLSLFRSICENGMVFGRKNLFGLSFTHMKDNVKTIQSQFELGSRSIGTEIIPIWQKWTQIPHTLADMTEFLDSRDYIKNEKKKERILVKYEEVMNREGHDDTRFGAFNCITEILTHHTQSRKEDTSNIFSSSYRNYEKLAMDFYSLPM